MLWETCVPQTTLGVTFGARLRSILLGLLDRPLGHLEPKDAQGLQNGCAWGTFAPPRSARDAFRSLPRHARGFILTSNGVSSP